LIRILYRTSPFENNKPRPDFYSKRVCLMSLLRAIDDHEATLHVLYDGPSPPEGLVSLVGRARIVCLGGLGNAASFEVALTLAVDFARTDLIYFVEDDYLHVPSALANLLACSRAVPADYITLYDHPVRYLSGDDPNVDWPLRTSATYEAAGHTWRTVESTCMTFAAMAQTLVEDRHLFAMYLAGRAHPADRALFRHLQGLGVHCDNSPCRLLFGPVPSLATHCELPWLAPGIDWEAIARATSS
jgi:hypothetical protein